MVGGSSVRGGDPGLGPFVLARSPPLSRMCSPSPANSSIWNHELTRMGRWVGTFSGVYYNSKPHHPSLMAKSAENHHCTMGDNAPLVLQQLCHWLSMDFFPLSSARKRKRMMMNCLEHFPVEVSSFLLP